MGLGSNLGNREDLLRFAIRSLSHHLDALRYSSPYSTRALCDGDQPRFLNAVVVGRTPLEPGEVLGLAKALEWLAGRRSAPRNAPRLLDVDLLIHGDQVCRTIELVLPHPRLRERRFVLAPLAEVAPDLPVPPDGATVDELLGALPGDQDVRRSTWSRPPL